MKIEGKKSLLFVFFQLSLVALLICGLSFLSAEAQQPKSGGVLKIGGQTPPRQLDPAKQKMAEEYLSAELIFDSLTGISRDSKVEPGLATKWESSEDSKTWTFYLRQGVKFHDGSDFTAEDVVSTLQRIQDPSLGSPQKTKVDLIKTTEVVDKYTVRFHLAYPYGQLDYLFVRFIPIVSKNSIDKLASHPIGTGPYKFKEYSMGDRIVLEKNPDYWAKDRYHPNRIELRIIAEPTVAIASLEKGEIDAYFFIPMESVERLKTVNDLNITSAEVGGWDLVAMRNDEPPFNDVRVRQALFHCINKEELLKAAVFGHGAPTFSSIPPSSPMFNKSLQFTPQNYEKAKQLLLEAGYPNGLEMDLHVGVGRPIRERLAVAFVEMVKPAGFNIHIQRVPWDKFIADIEGKAKMYVTGWFGRFPIDEQTRPWFHSKGSWNAAAGHFNNKRVDELLDLARETKSEEVRKSSYDEFQKIIRDEGPGVIPYSMPIFVGSKKYVKNFQAHPDMWITLKDVWLDK